VLLIALTIGPLAMAEAAGQQQPTEQPSVFTTPEEQPVAAELIAEHASVRPGGQTRIGVHFDIEDGWHIYAKEPGDAGLPTKVIWTSLLRDAIVTQFEWPPAQEFIDPGEIHTFGYSGTLVLAATLSTTSEVSVAAIPITAHAEWLACKEICLPGKADLSLALPVSPNTPVPSTHVELFAQTTWSP